MNFMKKKKVYASEESVPEETVSKEIDPTLVEKIAKAAKLRLTEKETQRFTQDLQEILKAFSFLSQLDVSGVRPSFQPIQHKEVLRDDVVKPSLTAEQALSFAKQKENGFFIGPKTID